MWATWWVWITLALILGIIEVLVPAYVFLGFALGSIVTGFVLFLDIGLSAWLVEEPGRLFVFAAAVSVVAWLVLRKVLGVRHGQVKIWDRDINED